jgi:hypothetical protein
LQLHRGRGKGVAAGGTERRAGDGFDVSMRRQAALAPYHRRIVAGAGVFQLARIDIQDADESGDEKAFRLSRFSSASMSRRASPVGGDGGSACRSGFWKWP